VSYKKRPYVSIIIPAYNAEEYISDTIESALTQTFSNVEVIVIDDGSTDGTKDIVGRFNDSRLRLLEADHRGAGAARNRGLRAAKGEYIQFLDSDDILSQDKIEAQLEVLMRSSDKKTIASCAWLKFEHNRDEVTLRQEEVWTVEDPIEWLICSLSGGGMMQPGAWLVHKDLIQAAGPWDESLSLHDDGEFFTRVLLQADRQIFVPGPRVYYRAMPGSLSRRRSRAAVESAFRVCQSRDRHLLARRDDQCSRQAIATQYAQFMYEFSSSAPDLADAAYKEIKKLRAKPLNVIGGRNFRRLATATGLRTALFIRNALSKY
jgi:glycosyltransferase involved in cell wall biosynthesis